MQNPFFIRVSNLILIWVPGGHGRPYKASKDVFAKKGTKAFYIRKYNSTVIASTEEEKDLFYVSYDIPFDDRENFVASPQDLSPSLMRDFLWEIKSPVYEPSFQMDTLTLARNFHLLLGPPESEKPWNVGILMFCEHPEQFFPYARIEVVSISDPTGQAMEEKTFEGPLQKQLKDALRYIKKGRTLWKRW